MFVWHRYLHTVDCWLCLHRSSVGLICDSLTLRLRISFSSAVFCVLVCMIQINNTRSNSGTVIFDLEQDVTTYGT